MCNSNTSTTTANNSETTKLRVFMIPYFAKGHLIPMTDFACLLAASHPDVELTMVVTPWNATAIRSTLDHAAASGHNVQLLTYPFPSHESVGVGAGSEPDLLYVDRAFLLTRPAHEELLRQHKPDAVVADANFWWVTATAADLGIPRLVFLITSTFACLSVQSLCKIRPELHLNDPLTIPGLPGPTIQIPLSELPQFVLQKENKIGQQMERTFNSELESFGAIINSMYELEPEYCKQYGQTKAKRSYFVGPISLFHIRDCQDALKRGGDGDATCLSWLDTKEVGSVVFVCFGSQSFVKAAQLHELALGLESSRKNFLWVVRADPGEEWMPEGWEERVAERGLMIRGWAPQLAILRHAAVGAFLTHCGWNSLLESIMCGVPMLTWPLEHEQFINERLIVDIKGCGARVWEGGKRSTSEAERELVPQEAIAEAVSRFMEPGGVGERVRSNACEMAAVAEAAMAQGGSSRTDLNRLIADLIEAKLNKACE